MAELDKLLSSLDDSVSQLEDFRKSSEAEIRASKEGVESLEKELAETKQTLAEVASVAKSVAAMPRTEAEKWAAAGAAIAKQYFDHGNTKGSVQPEELKQLDSRFGSDGGYLDSSEFLSMYESCQTPYGCIRQNAQVIPVNSDRVEWLAEKDAGFPSLAEPQVGEGCCDPCPAPLDMSGWEMLNATLSKIGRTVCAPREIVDNNRNFDVLGAYIIPRIRRHFDILEDWNGFKMLLNNIHASSYAIGGPAFTDLSIDDLLRLPFVGGKECGTDSRLFIHCSNISQLILEQGNDGHYKLPAIEWLLGANTGASLKSIFNLCNILPNAAESAPDTAFAFWGDLSQQLMLFERRGLSIASTDLHNFPCDVITIRATKRFGFAVHGEECSKNGVIVKTAE